MRSQTPSLLTFPVSFKWQQIVDRDVLKSSANLLLFRVLCSILLKYLDERLMSILVRIPLSMPYHENETWKFSFRLGGQ